MNVVHAASPSTPASAVATATFAGGCFWCMQSEFHSQPGVLSTTVGYTGGHLNNPTYEQVGTGTTGHFEAIQITYNPHQTTYQRLLEIFWNNIDPLDATGQFCDQGPQYRSAIFVATPQQRAQAEDSKMQLAARLKQPLVTQVLPASRFCPAEEYHQQYHLKNPFRYRLYRTGCGRDGRLNDLQKQRQGQP